MEHAREWPMGSFTKGATFTMEGKEYEVLSEGSNDPASCIVYVLRSEKETADPMTLRLWKAEARLARGDIMLNGGHDLPLPQREEKDTFFPPVSDPLEQIAELKKRIQAIEQRRLSLMKADDPKGEVLLQDNVVRPNKEFNIWNYTRAAGIARKDRNIQYVKIRGLMIAISGGNRKMEYFLFNIADQLQPCCRIAGRTLSSTGSVKIDLSPRLQSILGRPTQILSGDLFQGRIELSIEIRLNCQWATGVTSINARISQAAYIREVNGPVLKINRVSFPEIGNHMIAIEGICIDVYTDNVKPA